MYTGPSAGELGKPRRRRPAKRSMEVRGGSVASVDPDCEIFAGKDLRLPDPLN